MLGARSQRPLEFAGSPAVFFALGAVGVLAGS